MALFDVGSGLQTLANTVGNAVSAASTVSRSVNNIAQTFGNLQNITTVQGAIGAINNVAGNINNISSMLNAVSDPTKLGSAMRSINLPPGGEAARNPVAAAASFNGGASRDWRVKITIPPSFLGGPLIPLAMSDNSLVFPYTPNIQISGSAMYGAEFVTHQNYQFTYFQNGKTDQITISGPFNVEDAEQAMYWIAALHFLRSATKMFTGADSQAGNPPIICQLNGYGDFVFKNVPVIVTSFSVDLPQDVNYINDGRNSWVPVKSTLTVNLLPVYSRTMARTFSLNTFVNGGYVNAGYV